MITVTINGKPHELESTLTLVQYVESLGLNCQHIAAAHNGEVVSRENFGDVQLKEGDRLEIVRPVGGG